MASLDRPLPPTSPDHPSCRAAGARPRAGPVPCCGRAAARARRRDVRLRRPWPPWPRSCTTGPVGRVVARTSTLTPFMDRGDLGIRWSAVGAGWTGSIELWLESVGDGVLVHHYQRLDPVDGYAAGGPRRDGRPGARPTGPGVEASGVRAQGHARGRRRPGRTSSPGRVKERPWPADVGGVTDVLATTRCPQCVALVRPGQPWCTLCHADLRPLRSRQRRSPRLPCRSR